MIVETNPFPYLKPGQYVGLAYGEIVIVDKTVDKSKHEWLKKAYKKWWEERRLEK